MVIIRKDQSVMPLDSSVIGLWVQTEVGFSSPSERNLLLAISGPERAREKECVHTAWMDLSAWLPEKIFDA